MNSKKILLQEVIYVIGSILISMVVGTVLLTAVYLLPTSRIQNNLQSAVDMLENEGDGYHYAPWIGGSHLDNFTDAIMLNEAAYKSGNAIKDAMECSWISGEKIENWEALKYALMDPDNNNVEVTPYVVYWHGYLVWLKPLLMFATLADIRIMAMCIQFILTFFVLFELFRAGGYRLLIPMMATVLWFNPVSTALSMQLGCVYIISLLAVLFVLKTGIYEKKSFFKIFVWTGIATAFFDFLTYPIVSLGIPLLIMVALWKEDLAEVVKKVFGASLAWAFSYGLMWAGKWVVASLFLEDNPISQGIEKVLYRTSGNSGDVVDNISFHLVMEYNTLDFRTRAVQMVATILLLVLIYAVIKEKMKLHFEVKNIVIFGFVALDPFVWYFVVRNHSKIHSWMTYRNFGITILALLLLIAVSLQKDKQYSEDLS